MPHQSKGMLMAVSLASAANALAAPTNPPGSSEPIVVDSVYVPDFAEDLTLAMGRAATPDVALAVGLAVAGALSRHASMQAGASEVALQVLPPQVLKQAIERANLASASDPASLVTSPGETTESVAALVPEELPAALIPSIEDVLTQWDSRYFNVVRVDTQLRPGNMDIAAASVPDDTGPAEKGRALGDSILSAATHTIELRTTTTGVAATLLEPEAAQLIPYDVAADIPSLAEVSDDRREESESLTPRVELASASSAVFEDADDSQLQSQMDSGSSRDRVDQPMIFAFSSSAQEGVETGIDARDNGNLQDVQREVPDEPSASPAFVEYPIIAQGVTPASEVLDNGRSAENELAIRTAETSPDSVREVTTAIAEGGSSTDEDTISAKGNEYDTQLAQGPMTPLPATQASAVSAAPTSSPSLAASNVVTDRLPALLISSGAVNQTAQPLASGSTPIAVTFSDTPAPSGLRGIEAAVTQSDKKGLSIISDSDPDLTNASSQNAPRGTRLTEPVPATWLERVMNDDRVTKSSTNPVRLGQNLTIGGAASVSDSAASNVTHASVPIANGQVPQITLPTGVNLAASSGLIDQIRKNNNASTIADLSNATNPSALITPVAFPAEDNLPIVARLVASSNRSDTSSESSRAVPFGLSALSTSAGLDPSSEPSMISPATMAASRLGIAEVSGKTATVANSMAIIAGNAVGEDDHEPQMRGSKIERAATSDAAIAAAIKLSATESNSALIGAVTQALKVNAEPSAGVSPVMTRSDSVIPFTTNVLERQELKTDLIKNDVDPANIEVRSNDKDQGVSSRVTAEVNFVSGSSPALGLAPSSVISTDRFGAMSAPSQATSSSAQAASPLMNSVSVEIKQLLTNGGGSVRIALTPPEQGMLQLDLVVSDSGLATLEVFGVTESIRERLESGSTTLQRQFEQMGLTLSLSLFDHGKGSESPAARDPQVLNDKSADLPPGHTPRSAKRADAAVGDDTGTMINFIA